jgi:alanine racemase
VALRALASVNLAAIERNVNTLRGRLGPGTTICVVVKADGYGHGSVQVARAALRAGASSLAVATADEAMTLREAGIEGTIIVLGALSGEELPVALAAGAEVVAWDERFIHSLRAQLRGAKPVGVHVKLDSGMGRLGTRDCGQALAVARAVLDGAPGLTLAGATTHFATADGDQEFVARQLRAFTPFAEAVRTLAGHPITVHAANSAATVRTPGSHFDMVRCGIAVYGGDPMNLDPEPQGLEPALTLSSYVATVKAASAGDSAGYGRRFVADRETYIATAPIGYGDGISRGLTNNGDVLIGGRRYPLVGTVSMDNITIDVGPLPVVEVGEQVTLIGVDGSERQTAEDIAARLGTINYEVMCAISARVPRRYHHDGEPVQ